MFTHVHMYMSVVFSNTAFCRYVLNNSCTALCNNITVAHDGVAKVYLFLTRNFSIPCRKTKSTVLLPSYSLNNKILNVGIHKASLSLVTG